MRAALARHDRSSSRPWTGTAAGRSAHVARETAVSPCSPRRRTRSAAALAIQRAFVAEEWPTPRPIKVRIGLHTGEAELRDGDYYGAAVNRCARLRSIGHGGQVLLDRGDGDARAGPASRWRPAARSGGASSQGSDRARSGSSSSRQTICRATSRRSERWTLDRTTCRSSGARSWGESASWPQAGSLLLRDDVGLLTLTGPGGTGKTRLGLQVAADLIERFADGVFFVDLAPIADPALVPSTIAQVLGVREMGGQSILESLKEYLREKQLLLVLDNFEQVLPAATGRGRAAGGQRRAEGAGDQSRGAGGPRGARAAGAAAGPARSATHVARRPTLASYAAVALFVERASAIRARLRADRGERRGSRRDLRAPGRAAAGDRAGRRARPAALAGGGAGAAGAPADAC